MLSVESISAGYGAEPILRDVCFQVPAGEVVALIGPNGAGKTTLIRAISGLLPLVAGRIAAFGKDLAAMPPTQRARFIGVVPQARRLPASYTVQQTVLLGRTPHLGWLGRAGSSDLKRVEWALERTSLLDLSERLVEQLSGGEQQRVLLARALAQDTPILLLDEPTAHLDLHHQSHLLALVSQMAKEQEMAVLMAVHDLNLVSAYSQRVVLLVDGRVQADGSPFNVLTEENLAQAYRTHLHVIPHPIYGTPLVLLNGHENDPFAPPMEVGTGPDSIYARSLIR